MRQALLLYNPAAGRLPIRLFIGGIVMSVFGIQDYARFVDRIVIAFIGAIILIALSRMFLHPRRA